jgi:hypothetical protein
VADHRPGKSFGTNPQSHRIFIYGTLKRGHGKAAPKQYLVG